ncbi:helix-turn-helix domain-containing protein [Leuconostoc mesenteroides]|uniref:helix-turn-helix domain-containing protein n=2 Tax=Lactobacillaceae TaxID=33958 RepID=UPI003B5B981C
MHNQGRSYTDLSAEYGPSVDSIRNWVKLYANQNTHSLCSWHEWDALWKICPLQFDRRS